MFGFIRSASIIFDCGFLRIKLTGFYYKDFTEILLLTSQPCLKITNREKIFPYCVLGEDLCCLATQILLPSLQAVNGETTVV